MNVCFKFIYLDSPEKSSQSCQRVNGRCDNSQAYEYLVPNEDIYSKNQTLCSVCVCTSKKHSRESERWPMLILLTF